VERSGADTGVRVIEGGDEIRQGVGVHQTIEKVDAPASHDDLVVVESPTERRQRDGTGGEQVLFGPLSAGCDPELSDPAIEVGRRGGTTHVADGNRPLTGGY
jgi:hypothetical protein